jgi:hypothetical protein
MIAEKIKMDASAKNSNGWFKVKQVNVSYDHPFDAPYEHALNIDFVDHTEGLSNRIAVELSEQAARELVKTIMDVLDQAERKNALV